MKFLKISIIFLFFLNSCATYQDLNVHNFALSSTEKQFILNFENAVVKHKVKLLREMLHPIYKSQQLNDLYNGDANALFNDFFCGKDIQTNKFVCIKLRNVRDIELKNVLPGYQSKEKILVFKVQGYDHTIILELSMRPFNKDGKIKYGIIGAFG